MLWRRLFSRILGPQFCTVRYKVFSAPKRTDEVSGHIEKMVLTEEKMQSKVQFEKRIEKPKTIDIAEADIIVAVGRGFAKSE